MFGGTRRFCGKKRILCLQAIRFSPFKDIKSGKNDRLSLIGSLSFCRRKLPVEYTVKILIHGNGYTLISRIHPSGAGIRPIWIPVSVS